MTLTEITEQGVAPALALLPSSMDTPQARIILLAIALQESLLLHRRQMVGKPGALTPTGPAKSFWQGEQGGGMVHGVRTHPATTQHAAMLYRARGVQPTNRAIWDAIERDDVLAAGLARLLLWSEPGDLPAPEDEQGSWQLYLRAWRPGAWARGTPTERTELRAKWARNHRRAREFVGAP